MTDGSAVMADDGAVVDNTVGDDVSNGCDGTGVGDVDGNSTIEGLAEGAQLRSAW